MAEIVRGGIQSVDRGQSEAAGALGMSRAQTLRRIVLPQAMRVIVPPTGNETISMLKTTSLVVVIAYFELLPRCRTSTRAPSRRSRCSSSPHLVHGLTSVLSIGQCSSSAASGVVRAAAQGSRLMSWRARAGTVTR